MSNHLMYVSPAGQDEWSGRYDHPLPDGTDGPLATLAGARDRIRRMKQDGSWPGAMEVLIRSGIYRLAESVEFGVDDSGPVRYAAYPGETPVFDGGVRIDNWTEGQLNGRPVWIADLPQVRSGEWYFRQLFVNGRRMSRSRYPKQGYFTIEGVPGFSLEGAKENGLFAGSDRFYYTDGNIRPWRNLHDVDLIVHHYWVEERMPVERVDEDSRLVVSSRRSVFGMRDDEAKSFAHYYVENVWEEMSEPGEWYLDRAEGKLYYLPLPGEKPDQTEVVAPRIECFLRLNGDPMAGLLIESLTFSGLHFRHSDWHLPPGGDPENIAGIPGMKDLDLASSPQAAYWLPGAIAMYGARQCVIENCSIAHIGFYGIDLRHGCKEIQIVGNEIRDIGAGGIKISGASACGPASGPESMRTGQHLIADNHIHQGGKVFASACGIIVRHAYANVIAHNHIHDLYYTGISCGWEWTYRDNVTKDNIIEKNHIHDLGFGLMNDLGGIYLLGVQPGTVVRGNLIHHVTKKNYGGWGIYTDEGSSHIIVENNIVHHTHSQCFHQHYGRENMVRNNIFAFGQEGLASLTRIEKHNEMTYEKNIFLTDGSPVFLGKGENALQQRAFRSDGNLLWDIGGKPIVHANFSKDEKAQMICLESFDMNQFRALGYDLHSAVVNPGFRDPLNGDFTIGEDSPVIAHGFQPIDLSDVGPRTPVAIGQGGICLAGQRLLEGKIAIITGSTSGIGEAIARLYAQHGAKVTVTGRHAERGRDIVRSIEEGGGEAWFVGANLANHEDCVRIVEAAANRFHGIDIVVNNAAMVCSKSVEAITARDWDELFAVNLKAPFLLTQAALPWLEKSGQGKVINVSSINAVRNGARNLVYDSLKAGLNHMTRGLALDLRKKGIRCNALMPGGTHTPLLEQWTEMYMETPEKLAASKAQLIGSPSVAEPGQIAGAALMLACDYSSWVNGAEIAVDGGYYLGPDPVES